VPYRIVQTHLASWLELICDRRPGAAGPAYVITPLDAPQEFLSEAARDREAPAAGQDGALMRTLELAHHWQRLLDEGRFSSMTEIAAAEGIDLSQASKMS
jgi:hypothetical protein